MNAPPGNAHIGVLQFPPFEPPTIERVRPTSWAALIVRLLMVVWTIVVVLRIDDASDDPVPRSPSGVLTALGWVLVAAWLVVASRWSWLRTSNVHRLDGRYPTRARAAIVWVYPAVWVVLMGVTFIQAEPNRDFDYRPPIIVVGFLLAMVGGYRIVHRIFKSLVRMPPTATCVAFYVVDTAAFGLIWWRTTSWTGRDGVAPLDRDLDLGIMIAACVALTAGGVIAWYLDRAADRSQEIRLLALRTRYDHRMARLNGLDPMNPATRYALMLARRAAERAADRPVDDRTADAIAPDDPLVAELARELENGITPEFAERVRELERRTDGHAPTPRHTSPEPGDDPIPGDQRAQRLWLAELMRYLVVAAYVGCVAASVILVVAFSSDDADTVDLVRRLLVWGSAGVHVLVALWALRIAVDARRFGLPSLWRLPLGALGSSVVLIALWFGVGAEGDAASIGLFTVLTLGLELALWRITAIDWLVVQRESDSPLEAWMSVAPFVLGLVLLSPMRVELTSEVSTGRVGFFAAVIGLAAALAAGLAAVAMVQIEDALRATTPGERQATPEPHPEPAPPLQPTIVGGGPARATMVQVPTPKPRSMGPQAPLRVEFGDMTPEVARGLGLNDLQRARVAAGLHDPAQEDAPDPAAAAVEAVERAAVDAVERAAAGAVERAAVDAVERAAAGAVERAAAGAVERAAVEAAERAAVDAVERAAVDAVERAAVEAAERAAVEAAERAAAEAAERALRELVAESPRSDAGPVTRQRQQDQTDDRATPDETPTAAPAIPGGRTGRSSKPSGTGSESSLTPAERAAQLERTVAERLSNEVGDRSLRPPTGRPGRWAAPSDTDRSALDRVVERFAVEPRDTASEQGALAFEADTDHGGRHQDAADPGDQREVAGDEVGRLEEHVDDADHGEQDDDVPEPGHHADEAASPGER